MNSREISGLDMAHTIWWYEWCTPRLLNSLPMPTDGEFPLIEEVGSTTVLTKRDFAALLNLFPPSARSRFRVIRIEVLPALWFRDDSSDGEQKITTYVSRAISSTAIVPSSVAYIDRHPQFGLSSMIRLFDLSPHGLSEHVKRIIHAQGFVHGVAHALVMPELYCDNLPNLRLSGGRIVGGGEYLLGIQELVNGKHPISHYAGHFMENQKLKEMPSPNTLTPLSEVWAEVIAAHLLGFAYQPNGDGFNPFAGREELRDYVDVFLHAERVS